MEQQLAAMNWKPGELETRIHELQTLLQERDTAIRDLDMQLEEQVRQGTPPADTVCHTITGGNCTAIQKRMVTSINSLSYWLLSLPLWRLVRPLCHYPRLLYTQSQDSWTLPPSPLHHSY